MRRYGCPVVRVMPISQVRLVDANAVNDLAASSPVSSAVAAAVSRGRSCSAANVIESVVRYRYRGTRIPSPYPEPPAGPPG